MGFLDDDVGQVLHDPAGDMDFPCDICGNFPDDCVCPECPICGVVGDPDCYGIHMDQRGNPIKL